MVVVGVSVVSVGVVGSGVVVVLSAVVVVFPEPSPFDEGHPARVADTDVNPANTSLRVSIDFTASRSSILEPP